MLFFYNRLSTKVLCTLTCLIITGFIHPDPSNAQRAGYWQQELHYEMEIDMDVEMNRFDGTQKLTYTNNSPDTLNRVFYHLFFNAFQPNSMMDKRSRTIADPSSRISDKIVGYDSTQIGYQEIEKLLQNGVEVDYSVEGTILPISQR